MTRTVAYHYDPFNRRMAKVVTPSVGPATIEHYIYDGAAGAVDDDKQIVLRFDTAGQVSNRYLNGPAVDMVLADAQVDPSTGLPDHIYWPLADNLSTVRDLAEYDEQTGITSIVNHIQYDAFGTVTSETNAAVDTIFGFTGRESDEESDLYYYRARYYDPHLGQFASEDPLGFEAKDPNLSRYVGNGPVDAMDPSGLEELAWSGPSISAAPKQSWREGLADWWQDVWNNDYETPGNYLLREQDSQSTFVVRRLIHSDLKPIGGGITDVAKFLAVDLPKFGFQHSLAGLAVLGSRSVVDADAQRFDALVQAADHVENWEKIPSYQRARIVKRLTAGQATFVGAGVGLAKGLSVLKSTAVPVTAELIEPATTILAPESVGSSIMIVDQGFAGATEGLVTEIYVGAGFDAVTGSVPTASKATGSFEYFARLTPSLSESSASSASFDVLVHDSRALASLDEAANGARLLKSSVAPKSGAGQLKISGKQFGRTSPNE